jgi:hypothetical protein
MTQSSRLILFGETDTVYSENRAEHTDTLRVWAEYRILNAVIWGGGGGYI